MPEIRYREIVPCGHIAHFVQCFWEYENFDTPIKHTILPDGYFDLIVQFEGGKLISINLTGVWTKPVDVLIPQSTRIFAIRFKLLAAGYLFRNEIKSLLDTSKSLPLDYWGINTLENARFDGFAGEIENKIALFLNPLKAIDPRKLELFDFIYQNKPSTVKELTEHIIWSSRQMNRYFNEEFGFSLKVFLKIIRFKSSLRYLATGALFPQNDGYYDQAHYIKEVRHFSGTTPRKLFENKNDQFLQLSTRALE